MSPQVLGSGSEKMAQGMECRVWERYPCGMETSCQPVAARGDNDMSWAGQVRDLSVGGMGLVLNRRFERGTGLAVEIPETESLPADTLLAKVVHTTSLGGGKWLLGCQFISPLSEDELQRLVKLGQAPAAETVVESNPPGNEVQLGRIIWEGPVRAGLAARQLIRGFHLKGTWPLEEGTVLQVWFGKSPHLRTRLQVQRCHQVGQQWLVRYRFLDRPPAEILHSFGYED